MTKKVYEQHIGALHSERNAFADDFPFPAGLSMFRTYHWLMAYMHYPESPLAALAYFFTELINGEMYDLAGDDDVAVPVGWLRALCCAPSLDDRAKKDKNRFKDGMTAGWLLGLIYAMQRNNVKTPSLNKAVEILEKLKIENVHSEKTKIFAAWGLMKPVAHLWGSMVLLDTTDKPPKVTPGPDGLVEYLQWAVSLLEFGCKHIPSHTKLRTPILDRKHCLRLPEYILPKPDIDISIPIPPRILEIIDGYRPPQKN
ncbi:hypothetical protein ACFDR9_004502 [Janthinobacterium sp. CG_23.3]|uniref:hypothetical protein n=1 Tax=Janthinobacterium sp. CG_23.3 TaxID=3349634 RepID=UPI0038D3FF8D